MDSQNYQDPAKDERRYKVLSISPDFVTKFCGGVKGRVLVGDLPDGSAIRSCSFDMERGCFALYVENPSFDPVPLGQPMESLDVVINVHDVDPWVQKVRRFLQKLASGKLSYEDSAYAGGEVVDFDVLNDGAMVEARELAHEIGWELKYDKEESDDSDRGEAAQGVGGGAGETEAT